MRHRTLEEVLSHHRSNEYSARDKNEKGSLVDLFNKTSDGMNRTMFRKVPHTILRRADILFKGLRLNLTLKQQGNLDN